MMLRRRVRLWMMLGLAATVAVASAAADQAKKDKDTHPKANPDALVLVDYNKRIKDYLDLRKPLKAAAPPLEETKDPEKITAAQEGLAAKLREARKQARPGEIFTPEIRQAFRRLLYPETTGTDGRLAKEAIKADAPKPDSVHFKVNAKYPDAQPLPTVPPAMLANLPPLPEDLEYRIIGKHLILRDTQANIIVDYIPNVIR